MAGLLDVGLVNDWLTREDILEVPRHDDQQILPSTCPRSHGVPEAWLALPGEQVPSLELDSERNVDSPVPAISQQPHIREGLG